MTHIIFSRTSRFSVLLVIFLAMTFSGVIVPGQTSLPESKPVSGKPTVRELLPAILDNSWRATNAARRLSVAQFSVVQDAEVYAEYGLQSVTSRSYRNGPQNVLVEVYEMQYPSGAYGLFTFNRGTIESGRQEFQAGRYLVRISSGTENVQPNHSLINAIEKYIAEDQTDPPILPNHLPEQHKIANSEKYITGNHALTSLKPFADLGELISFTGGAEAVTADYENGTGKMSLLIVDCYTPQLAAENYRRLKSHIETLSPAEQAGRIIKRPGNYIIEAVNVSERTSAQAIVDAVKYAPRVYWEGDKFSSIPFEFRPPDPLALEEAKRTGAFLVAVFSMISLMIIGSVFLGVIAGGSFFYWRRYQRRKLGFEDAFSDAGGSIRLNLDNYLFPKENAQPRLPGKHD